MSRAASPRRGNQRFRTRKDLLLAARRLMAGRRKPTMDEITEEAKISRATAYRYFPSLEALLVEAPLEGELQSGNELFANDASTDPEQRILKAESALHEMCSRNEAQLRLMLAQSLARDAQKVAEPIRQNRRTDLIEAALAPARRRFRKASYDRLRAAAAVLFGIESIVVFRDVLGVDDRRAGEIRRWALRALVRAALEESKRAGAR